MNHFPEWKKEFRDNFFYDLESAQVECRKIESFIDSLLAKQRQEVLIGYVSHETMVSQINAVVKGAYEEAAKVAENDMVFGKLPYPEHRRSWDKGVDDARASIIQAIRRLSTESEKK